MGALFGGGGGSAPPPVMPQIQKPALLPDEKSPAVLEAKRRAQMDMMSRAGRSSTILTSPGNRGGDYSKVTLGGET